MHASKDVCPLIWATLMGCFMGAMGQIPEVPYPGIFEVDFLFPRNETYTPQAVMPIVFAVQNPRLASPLAAWISWDLWEGNNQSSPGSVTGGAIELSAEIYSPNETLLISRIINTMAYPEGFWTFSWDLMISNCSGPGNNTTQDVDVYGTTVFTVNQSGQEPDLVAATSFDTCNSTEAYAFDAISLINPCGVLKPSQTANPCSATINPSAASSILAEGTAGACEPGQQNPNVTCPTYPSKSSASSADFNSRLLIAAASILLAILGTVIYL